MNLGIEDAWIFAQLARRGELARYESLRYPIDRGVVRQVSIFSRIVACEPAPLRIVRGLLPLLLRLGLPTPRMMAIVTGSDHPLGEFSPSQQPPAGPADLA
jgi:2-polyprenyl-6-methoxyphenol hydroxylase-like FAD-dependent oxidoreductase